MVISEYYKVSFNNITVLVNGKDYYDCYKSDCGANIFRYGKHQKQAHCDYQLNIDTIQIVGVTK